MLCVSPPWGQNQLQCKVKVSRSYTNRILGEENSLGAFQEMLVPRPFPSQLSQNGSEPGPPALLQAQVQGGSQVQGPQDTCPASSDFSFWLFAHPSVGRYPARALAPFSLHLGEEVWLVGAELLKSKQGCPYFDFSLRFLLSDPFVHLLDKHTWGPALPLCAMLTLSSLDLRLHPVTQGPRFWRDTGAPRSFWGLFPPPCEGLTVQRVGIVLLAEGLAFHLFFSKSVTRSEMRCGCVCGEGCVLVGQQESRVLLAWFKTQSVKERVSCLVFASYALWLLSDRNRTPSPSRCCPTPTPSW